MKRETGLFRKAWIFFKKGKSEIWFVISLYNTIQLWTIQGINPYRGCCVLVLLGVSAFFLGIFLTKKVETTNPYVNPYTQDNIKASILFYEAFKIYIENELEFDLDEAESNLNIALEKVNEALKIRYKWRDKGLLK